MTVLVVVGLVGLVLLIYVVSALGPLPWYTYPPFVILFGIVFFWDRLPFRRGSNTVSWSKRFTRSRGPKRPGGRSLRRGGGKRM
ncbi:MAG: hypothetical protein JXR59_04480 [Desulfuromonadaceae bacterium]|nr:hypothetical protein [Desulfuromonadaceae bacterium]